MLEPLLETILLASSVLFIYMTFWYIVAVLVRRNDVADIAWGIGFIVVAIVSVLANQNFSATSVLTLVLVSFWGVRLSWHIAKRNSTKPEDYRYKAWRVSWGKWFYLRSYLQVFMLQGLFLLLVSWPIFIISTYATESISWLVIIGLFVWIAGFTFESIGDWQLKEFIRQPSNKGKIMTKGLWHYTRHPNYFGEITQWWGLGIIALSCSFGWLGLIGPLTITILIVKVSGVPLLEQKYANDPSYQEYKKRTPKLIPGIKTPQQA